MRKKWRHEHPEYVLLRNAKRRAKEKGLEFTLTAEDIHIPEVCPLLGIFIHRNLNGDKATPNSPTLDRIDSSKGYTKDGERTMIAMQSGMKGTLTVQGIPWMYLSYNSKVGFGFGRHAIIFDLLANCYVIKENGETVFGSGSVSECLEQAAPIVWDYYANQFTPSWEK